jgi:hypothetical protein
MTVHELLLPRGQDSNYVVRTILLVALELDDDGAQTAPLGGVVKDLVALEKRRGYESGKARHRLYGRGIDPFLFLGDFGDFGSIRGGRFLGNLRLVGGRFSSFGVVLGGVLFSPLPPPRVGILLHRPE